MRITVDTEDELMAALMTLHPSESKARPSKKAFREYIRTDTIAKLGAMAGTMNIQDQSRELRAGDRHT